MASTASLESYSQARAADESERRVRALKPGWSIVAAGATVPIGMAIAAAVTSSMQTATDRVAMAAWIVVGVVGTASVISTAAVLRGQRPRRVREKRTEKGSDGRSRESVTR